MGVFFGYPHEEIKWFINTPRGKRVSLRTRAENDEFDPVELAYVDLLPYRHDTSIAGYERTIDAGKRIRHRITVFVNRWGLPALDAMPADRVN